MPSYPVHVLTCHSDIRNRLLKIIRFSFLTKTEIRLIDFGVNQKGKENQQNLKDSRKGNKNPKGHACVG